MDAKHLRNTIKVYLAYTLSYSQKSNLRGKVIDYCDNSLITVCVL